MIDTSKQYTYNGKPVRIYADGSDTFCNHIHIAYLNDNEWLSSSCKESDLVEVWEPKEGELVWAWHECFTAPHTFLYGKTTFYTNYAPFKGELPEAFKGLVMTKKERT